MHLTGLWFLDSCVLSSVSVVHKSYSYCIYVSYDVLLMNTMRCFESVISYMVRSSSHVVALQISQAVREFQYR